MLVFFPAPCNAARLQTDNKAFQSNVRHLVTWTILYAGLFALNKKVSQMMFLSMTPVLVTVRIRLLSLSQSEQSFLLE